MHEHYTPNKTAAEIRFDIELFKHFAPTTNTIESIRSRGVLNNNRRRFDLGAVVLPILFYGISIALVAAAICAAVY
jgi:hypothetical protein